MMQNPVEPSEIIIGGASSSSSEKKGGAFPLPWLRFLARFFDYALFFLLLKFLFPQGLAMKEIFGFIPVEFIGWVPLEAIFLFVFKTTPGKFFLRLSLSLGKGGKIDFKTALQRSFLVWLRGMGMGIMIIIFFCLLNAYQRFQMQKQTSWDRELYITCSSRPVGKWRLFLATAVILLGMWYGRGF